MLVNLAARISLLKYLQCRVFTLDHSLSSEPSNKKDGACDQQTPEQNHTEQANPHHGHPSTIRESVHHLLGLFVLESPLSCSTTVLPLNRLFLEQAKGYVKALEKSTSAPSTMREVFEHCAERLGRRKNRHVSLPESQLLSRPSRSSGKAVREDSGLRAGHTVRYGPPACP